MRMWKGLVVLVALLGAGSCQGENAPIPNGDAKLEGPLAFEVTSACFNVTSSRENQVDLFHQPDRKFKNRLALNMAAPDGNKLRSGDVLQVQSYPAAGSTWVMLSRAVEAGDGGTAADAGSAARSNEEPVAYSTTGTIELTHVGAWRVAGHFEVTMLDASLTFTETRLSGWFNTRRCPF
ncbi:MAG: hypothetical protein HY904_03180 [Deltaproteobacteria bacterium]|nr:hypothetical protein [Deltaproteobacteria bacterium]